MAIEPKQTLECLFHQLGDENILGVFEKISFTEYGTTLRLVCQVWNNLSDDNILWRPVATALRFKWDETAPIHLQVKSAIHLNLCILKEADTVVDSPELTAREIDNQSFDCFFDRFLDKKEKTMKLSAIQEGAIGKIERCAKISNGFRAIIFLSRIGKSDLKRAEHYANQYLIKGESAECFVQLVHEAIHLGLVDQAKMWMLQITDKREFASAKCAFIRMYCKLGKFEEAISELKLIDISERGKLIPPILDYIPTENYSLREEVILLDSAPFLNLHFLIQELVQIGKKKEAKEMWQRNDALLNDPSQDMEEAQLQMDVWFGMEADAFARIKKLDLQKRRNSMLLFLLKHEMHQHNPQSKLLPEVDQMISELP